MYSEEDRSLGNIIFGTQAIHKNNADYRETFQYCVFSKENHRFKHSAATHITRYSHIHAAAIIGSNILCPGAPINQAQPPNYRPMNYHSHTPARNLQPQSFVCTHADQRTITYIHSSHHSHIIETH